MVKTRMVKMLTFDTDKYDYQSHKRAVKLMAFELWQDVTNGKRNAITFEIIHRPMMFGK